MKKLQKNYKYLILGALLNFKSSDTSIYKQFKQLGILHLFTVSGLHTVFIYQLIMFILIICFLLIKKILLISYRMFLFSSYKYITNFYKNYSSPLFSSKHIILFDLLTILFTLIYIWLIDAGIPAYRALIFLFLYIILKYINSVFATKIENNYIKLLIVSFLFFLIFGNKIFANWSFLLSFIITLAIILAQSIINKLLNAKEPFYLPRKYQMINNINLKYNILNKIHFWSIKLSRTFIGKFLIKNFIISSFIFIFLIPFYFKVYGYLNLFWIIYNIILIPLFVILVFIPSGIILFIYLISGGVLNFASILNINLGFFTYIIKIFILLDPQLYIK